MAFVDWLPEYTTGWTAYDTQHHRLIDLVNELHGLVEAYRPGDERRIAARFDEFIDLVRVHARTEDDLMARLGHPPATEHEQAHQAFLQMLLGVSALEDLGVDGHPSLVECLQKFKTHFQGDDEQSFLALLRTQSLL